MSIHYDPQTRLFLLNAGTNLSYAFHVEENGFATHLYFGPRIGEADILKLDSQFERPFSPVPEGATVDQSRENQPQEFAGFNTGDYRTPSVKTVTGNGWNASSAKYRSHRIFPGKPELEGLPSTFGKDSDVETLALTLFDEATGMEYELFYSVFREEDAIARSCRAINRGKEPVYLEKLASTTVDFRGCENRFDLVELSGAWARERHLERNPLSHGLHLISSNRGLSGHNFTPGFVLAERDAGENHGVVYGFALLYSGNFAAEIEYNQFSDVRVQLGIHPETFRWKLEPGEIFTAPEAVMVTSENGLGEMSRTFHDLFRNHLIRSEWKDRKRPILINNWEATYFDFNREKLLAIAKTAAEHGIEMLVLDDGWFGKRNNSLSGLGDWTVNREKLPGGLTGLARDINALGMKFGLWFEPEMISPDSDLYRNHPDWCLHIPGRPGSLGRHQLVLDMSRADVVDYLFGAICKILDEANVEYIKWDANRSLSEVGSALLPPDRRQEVAHRFVLGTYSLHERLLKRYKHLLIEGCSGGGGRFDAGMLYYVPQIWCSDDSDAVERLNIQYGTSLFYPCSTMGAHVSACPNHQTGRTTPFQTRGIVAMAGTFGYELDLNKLSEEERECVKRQVQLYHRVNPLVTNGDLYRLSSPEDAPFTAWMNLAKDGSEFVLSAITPKGGPKSSLPVRRIRLAGLENNAIYEDEESGERFRGDFLMKCGWLLPSPACDAAAELRIFRKI